MAAASTKKSAKPTLEPQTGWSLTEAGCVSDHPVRSIKGGFAAFFFMSRPPLLARRGFRSYIVLPF
jgi:hypothetical protein